MGAGTLGFPGGWATRGCWVPGVGDAALGVRGWPQFPRTDGLARWQPEMPGRARRLDPPVGGRGRWCPCARPSPRAPRPQIPSRDLGSWGLKVSPAAWFLPWFRGPPASWATPVLYPGVAPLPPQSSGLPPARQFPFLPSPWGLFLTNSVEQCRWNQPGVEGPPRTPFPIRDPPGLPPARPHEPECGVDREASLKPLGQKKQSSLLPHALQCPS